jgi:hypothetical protein
MGAASPREATPFSYQETAMNICPTPEFMEAFGRAERKYGFAAAANHVQDEMWLMREHRNSVCAGLQENEGHQAVAKEFPHLYSTAEVENPSA